MFSKKLCSLAIFTSLGLQAMQTAKADINNPNILATSSDKEAFQATYIYTDESNPVEALAIREFIARRLNVYQDQDDKNLYWLTPVYSADAKSPLNLVPNSGRTRVHSNMLDFRIRLDSLLDDDFFKDEPANDFDDKISETEDAALANDGIVKSNAVALAENAYKSLSPERLQIMKTKIVNLLSAASEPISVNADFATAITAERASAEKAAGMVSVPFFRGYTPIEVGYLEKFRAKFSQIKFKTLSLKDNKVSVLGALHGMETGKDSEGANALRSESDRNRIVNAIEAAGAKDLPGEGGRIAYQLDWPGYKSLVDMFGVTFASEGTSVPFPLPLNVNGQIKLKFSESASADMNCEGRLVIQGRVKIEASKYANNAAWYFPPVTREVAENKITPEGCVVKNVSGNPRLLEEQIAANKTEFRDAFSTKVAATNQFIDEIMSGVGADAQIAFESAFPEVKKKKWELGFVQSCERKYNDVCVARNWFKQCTKRKLEFVGNDCKDVLHWQERQYTETHPFHYAKSVNVNQLATLEKYYPLAVSNKVETTITVQMADNNGVCLKGKLTSSPLAPAVVACETGSDLVNGSANGNTETRGGSPTPNSGFEF